MAAAANTVIPLAAPARRRRTLMPARNALLSYRPDTRFAGQGARQQAAQCILIHFSLPFF